MKVKDLSPHQLERKETIEARYTANFSYEKGGGACESNAEPDAETGKWRDNGGLARKEHVRLLAELQGIVGWCRKENKRDVTLFGHPAEIKTRCGWIVNADCPEKDGAVLRKEILKQKLNGLKRADFFIYSPEPESGEYYVLTQRDFLQALFDQNLVQVKYASTAHFLGDGYCKVWGLAISPFSYGSRKDRFIDALNIHGVKLSALLTKEEEESQALKTYLLGRLKFSRKETKIRNARAMWEAKRARQEAEQEAEEKAE